MEMWHTDRSVTKYIYFVRIVCSDVHVDITIIGVLHVARLSQKCTLIEFLAYF